MANKLLPKDSNNVRKKIGFPDFNQWLKNKNFSYNRIHFMLSAGRSLLLSGNTWDAYESQKYLGYFLGSFGGPPKEKNTSTYMNVGLQYSLNNRIRLGVWALPEERKEFKGGRGEADLLIVFFFPFPVIYTGQIIEEKIRSQAYTLNTSFILIPYQQKKKIGIELSADAGFLMNKLNVETILTAYDTLHYTDGNPGYKVQEISGSKKYDESKMCFGGTIGLQMNIYIGKTFSLFANLNAGVASRMNIAEKSFTVMRQTAYSPAHYEKLKGFGGSVGIALHLWQTKAKLTDIE